MPLTAANGGSLKTASNTHFDLSSLRTKPEKIEAEGPHREKSFTINLTRAASSDVIIHPPRQHIHRTKVMENLSRWVPFEIAQPLLDKKSYVVLSDSVLLQSGESSQPLVSGNVMEEQDDDNSKNVLIDVE
ncbi:hypothetical protein NC653_020509 [Populus alba x Populus x berolinensis]|uniref:Uncharacterized protein n=1 Tax=Populus alba x Populus x berolinensis TaxID=444605 RepID=A0AAD6MLB4_9ROSI|nr:hypothetical protein NC653_020499 [Populus alba x Populus x berolinensis]KAJ6987284.1 hypothetical protein NC653_020509 [Populus alba x Populus x berolinensis]